ncbi:MAG: MSCRAMM family adhesin SdrC [Planctomycetaceae bacterium]|jgi:DNA-binding ferritin-like protein (Dps family)|nr:MSCRAMM family adhesin SdrC [Planctomycetaceae bacterium]
MSIKKTIFFVVFGGCFLLQYFLPLYSAAAELSEKQRVLANKYIQLEQTLSRMSMATSKTDPKRAALLEKVLLLSKEKLVGSRLENIVVLLEKKRLGDSALGQNEVGKDIAELLQLLESDNKKDVNALKREQLQKLIKELTDLYNKQRINAQRTASQDKENLEPITDEQEKLRRLTDEIRKRLDEQEGRTNNPNDNKENQADKQNENESGKSDKSKEDQSNKPNDNKSDDSKESLSGKPNDNKSDDSKESQSGKPNDSKSSDSKEGQSSKPNDSKSGDSKEGQSGKPNDSKSSDSKEGQSGGEQNSNDLNEDEGNDEKDSNEDSDAENSPQRDLKKASKHQQQAKKNLKENNKNQAHSDMDAAAADIIKAKEKLIRMLRQLREEELMQTLEKLNTRFKRMLQMEQSIRSQTEVLGNEVKLIGADSGEMRQVKIRADKLGEDQGNVMNDADAALMLLREDGTAQAMLESLLQVRFDVEEAKSRLEKMEIDTVTLEIEDAVITALKEMIEAVEEAIKESKDRLDKMKDEPQPNPQGEQKEPLIQLLAELKMIKSMQSRVNERTERYEKLTTKKLRDEPKADLEPIRKSVEELTRQQNRISKILHDIKVGKTGKK